MQLIKILIILIIKYYFEIQNLFLYLYIFKIIDILYLFINYLLKIINLYLY